MLYAPLTSEWLREQGSNKPFCDEHQGKVGKGTFRDEGRGLLGFNPLNKTREKKSNSIIQWLQVYFTLGKCTSTHFQ